MPEVRVAGQLVEDWHDLRFASGAAKRASPDRPSISYGSGRLSATGLELDGRHSLEVADGVVTLLRGFVHDRVTDPITGVSQYQIEGTLARRSREQVELSQNSAVAQSNSAAVQGLLRSAFGVAAVDVSLAPTPLRRYGYSGGAGGYAARYALVSGGVPYVTTLGGVGVKDPTRVPGSNVATVGSATYRIASIETQNLDDALWNSAVVPYIDDGGTTRQRGSRRFTWSTNSNTRGAKAFSVDLGDPPANSRYANVRAGYTGVVSAHVVQDVNGARLEYFTPARVNPSPVFRNVSVLASASLNGNIISIRVPAAPDSVRLSVSASRDASTFRNADWSAGDANGFHVREIVQAFAFSYDIITDDVPGNINVESPASIARYGRRTLNFPTWFADTAGAAVQSRINALSQPRSIHTVALYMDQRDTMRSQHVALIQPGDFLNLPDTGKVVFVQHVSISLSQSGANVKVLTCIETGQDHVPTIPLTALTWMGTPLTWRGSNVTWR